MHSHTPRCPEQGPRPGCISAGRPPNCSCADQPSNCSCAGQPSKQSCRDCQPPSVGDRLETVLLDFPCQVRPSNCRCAAQPSSCSCAGQPSKQSCRDCQPPSVGEPLDTVLLDFPSQVRPEDILPSAAIQTSPSLLCRDPGLPQRRRCFNRLLAPSKCLPCRDCQTPSPKQTAGCSREAESQTEPWQVNDVEWVQTGPSLDALGPFCRFDYKLKKTRSAKDDSFCDCLRPRVPENVVVCSIHRFSCCDFSQLVCALDIGVDEIVQTEEEPSEFWPDQVIPLPATVRQRCPVSICEKVVCPGSSSRQCVDQTVQVSQLDISPTKLTQTDDCLCQSQAVTHEESTVSLTCVDKPDSQLQDKVRDCSESSESLTSGVTDHAAVRSSDVEYQSGQQVKVELSRATSFPP